MLFVEGSHVYPCMIYFFVVSIGCAMLLISTSVEEKKRISVWAVDIVHGGWPDGQQADTYLP